MTMTHHLNQTISLLTQTPATLNALLRDLPEPMTLSNEGENTWTIFEVVGHLGHCERNDWMPRVRIIMESGEAVPFPPLARGGHVEESKGKSLHQLLEEFAQARSEKLHELHALNLQHADLERRGCHPALGVVTLSQLLSTWATHDLTHLHQITRILAHQYRDDVGPWSAYLGVLKCDGHSS
jgi:hypothetical protein